ncbi:hypothetical protein AB0F92_10195 [Kitasatospora aureofaciens]|uniref:hypothetical protein n=1 Tax=Kitasatospora aureofaciens TaxID=1894 RepID=UPI0033D8D9AA
MAERRYEYAPAGTLPGLLQRGRGLGALMAAEDPGAAAELVYGCIRWEWCWDPRVDERGRYLARLIRDLELPLGPVVEVLSGAEEARARAVRVLGLLALGGSAEAREALGARGALGALGAMGASASAWRERAGAGAGSAVGHGEERDVPALVAELERAWVDRAWCGPTRLARGLARFGPEAADAVSLLRRFWLQTPHSSERAAYLEALAALGSAGMAEAYTESLWDCEADARLLGAEHAPDTPQVRARLAFLRDDPIEEPEVSNTAGARLAGLAPAGGLRGCVSPGGAG